MHSRFKHWLKNSGKTPRRPQKTVGGCFRRLRLELLETRQMLSAAPTINMSGPLIVQDDVAQNQLSTPFSITVPPSDYLDQEAVVA